MAESHDDRSTALRRTEIHNRVGAQYPQCCATCAWEAEVQWRDTWSSAHKPVFFHNKSRRGTSETRVSFSLMLRKLRARYLHLKTLQFFSTAYTHNLYLSHNFWNLTLKHQNHTPNLQNHTQILGLWLSFQFHKALFLHVTHKNLTGSILISFFKHNQSKCHTIHIHQCLTLTQGSSNLTHKIHFPGEFSSNPNQTHLSYAKHCLQNHSLCQ